MAPTGMAQVVLVGTSVSSHTWRDWLCVPPWCQHYNLGLAPKHPSSYLESCLGPDVIQMWYRRVPPIQARAGR